MHLCLSVFLSMYCLSVCLSTCWPIRLPPCLSVFLSIYLSIYLPICDSFTLFRRTRICCEDGSVLIAHTTASHRQLADRQMHLARFLRSLLRYERVTLQFHFPIASLPLPNCRRTDVINDCFCLLTALLRQDRRRVRRGCGDHQPSGGDRGRR
jgi:hypothetical protein